MNVIGLGDRVKCRITGIVGIVIARSQHLYGCDRIGIQPPVGSDGKVPEALWGDMDSVEILERQVVEGHSALPPANKTGGPSLPGQTPQRENPR